MIIPFFLSTWFLPTSSWELASSTCGWVAVVVDLLPFPHTSTTLERYQKNTHLIRTTFGYGELLATQPGGWFPVKLPVLITNLLGVTSSELASKQSKKAAAAMTNFTFPSLFFPLCNLGSDYPQRQHLTSCMIGRRFPRSATLASLFAPSFSLRCHPLLPVHLAIALKRSHVSVSSSIDDDFSQETRSSARQKIR